MEGKKSQWMCPRLWLHLLFVSGIGGRKSFSCPAENYPPKICSTSGFPTAPFCFVLLFFCFSWPHPQDMEVPRLGVQLEQQLQAYTRGTAMWDLSLICDLHRSSGQHQTLSHWGRPGIEPTFSDASQIHFHCTMTGTSPATATLWQILSHHHQKTLKLLGCLPGVSISLTKTVSASLNSHSQLTIFHPSGKQV